MSRYFEMRSSLYSACAKLLFVSMLALGISACASAPDLPLAEVNKAEKTLTRAEESRAAEYPASSEVLRQSREKLASARKLLQKATQEKDEAAAVRAKWLAEESMSDAELAIAKAEHARATKVNREMEDTIGALKEELNSDL